MLPEVYFHVGYFKAASTSLQLNLFAHHPEIEYLCHFRKLPRNKEFKIFYRNLKILSPNEDENKNNNYKFYLENIQPYLSESKVNVFSDEGIVNQFDDVLADNNLKAQRIKTIFPKTKIIIVIRNQLELIRSYYDYEINNLLLDKWLANQFEKQHNFLCSLNFNNTIKLYQKLFGSENVGVFLFEDLKNNPQLFSEKISNFMNICPLTTKTLLGQKPKNSYDSPITKFRKIRAKVLPKLPFHRFVPGSILKSMKKIILRALEHKKIEKSVISPEYVEKIRLYYRESNRKLQEEMEIELDKYNYPM